MMRTRADNNQIVGRTATESVQLQSSTRVRRPVQWQKKNAILIEKDRRHQINVSSSMLSPDILQQIFRSRLGTTINLQISSFSLFRLLKGLVFRLLNGFVQSYESSPTQIRIPCPIVQVMRQGTSSQYQKSYLDLGLWFVKLNHYSQMLSQQCCPKKICWNYVKSSVKPFLRFQIVRHTS